MQWKVTNKYKQLNLIELLRQGSREGWGGRDTKNKQNRQKQMWSLKDIKELKLSRHVPSFPVHVSILKNCKGQKIAARSNITWSRLFGISQGPDREILDWVIFCTRPFLVDYWGFCLHETSWLMKPYLINGIWIQRRNFRLETIISSNPRFGKIQVRFYKI